MKTQFLCLVAILLLSCKESGETNEKGPTIISKASTFGDYWYRNGAEISSYRLEQARYGEIHEGTAVLVYVTEPFSKSKHVKLDDYANAGDDKETVLKLNFTKKFITGIYPYSMMLSTFSSVDGAPMLKSTMSSQEWCGQTFLQMNKRDSGYQYSGFSYFESEGDVREAFNQALAEDQIWTTLRLNPEDLPQGEFTFIPSAFRIRLGHLGFQTRRANGRLIEVETSDFYEKAHFQYSLKYDDRTLIIYFGKELPHQIYGWEETTSRGINQTGPLTTTGRLINTIRSRYWNKNGTQDRQLREQLGLPIY